MWTSVFNHFIIFISRRTNETASLKLVSPKNSFSLTFSFAPLGGFAHRPLGLPVSGDLTRQPVRVQPSYNPHLKPRSISIISKLRKKKTEITKKPHQAVSSSSASVQFTCLRNKETFNVYDDIWYMIYN